MRGAITEYVDVAQIVLYAFWLFFAGLLFYLRREDRREGYPLESEAPPGFRSRDFLWIPSPKTFLLAGGRQVLAPDPSRADDRPINAVKTEVWPGAPLTPTGDPLLANVGPGSYGNRTDEPHKTATGEDLLAPLRVATNFGVPEDSPNPIGYAVYGADREQGAVISDIWVDRAEAIIRYYEMALPNGKQVLVPVYFADVSAKQRRVTIKALLGSQFGGVPATRNPDRVTLLEEDKISAYYGAGLFYSTPARAEPLL